jgi:hypothetical protein
VHRPPEMSVPRSRFGLVLEQASALQSVAA